ncbi:MAG: hypothetical protein HY290_23425 [Planctomycetia bacterium]|nr:hypothetical protein [Planctomycetia bacterium]
MIRIRFRLLLVLLSGLIAGGCTLWPAEEVGRASVRSAGEAVDEAKSSDAASAETRASESKPAESKPARRDEPLYTE